MLALDRWRGAYHRRRTSALEAGDHERYRQVAEPVEVEDAVQVRAREDQSDRRVVVVDTEISAFLRMGTVKAGDSNTIHRKVCCTSQFRPSVCVQTVFCRTFDLLTTNNQIPF